MAKMKKTVLFDLDGVVTDTAKLDYFAWKKLAGEYSWRVPGRPCRALGCSRFQDGSGNAAFLRPRLRLAIFLQGSKQPEPDYGTVRQVSDIGILGKPCSTDSTVAGFYT